MQRIANGAWISPIIGSQQAETHEFEDLGPTHLKHDAGRADPPTLPVAGHPHGAG